MNTDTKEARGLAVDGQVYCATCQEPVAERFLASRGDGRHSKSFVVNRQAVYSSLVLLTTEVRPVQTPVDSDIIARSAGQPPIQKLNASNCYARGQLRMQRNQTLPTPVQPDALNQQLHGYREDSPSVFDWVMRVAIIIMIIYLLLTTSLSGKTRI